MRNGGKGKVPPAALRQNEASEVFFVQTLHHEDDSAAPFVVESGDRTLRKPIIDPLSARIRDRLFGLYRIIDDQVVRAETDQRAANRGRLTISAFGRVKELGGWSVGGEPRTRKQTAIPFSLHDLQAHPAEADCQVFVVANADDFRCWVVTQQPSDIGDRHQDRFEVARRDVEGEAICRPGS